MPTFDIVPIEEARGQSASEGKRAQRQPIAETNRVDVEETRFLASLTTVFALVLLGVIVILSDRYGARVWGITTIMILVAGALSLRYQGPRRILAAAAAEWQAPLSRLRGVFRGRTGI